MGHAWQSLALAAQALGCDSFGIGHFADDHVARFCRLSEDEWPMLIVELRSSSIPVREPDGEEPVWYGGHANQLSAERIPFPLIDAIHDATKLNNRSAGRISAAEPSPSGSGEIELPLATLQAAQDAATESVVRETLGKRRFGEVARTRRSALDFVGGTRSISFTQLSIILSAATGPLHADFAGARFIQLYLYAHRVDGLLPGVYRLWPEHAELEQIRSGDQRVAAAGLSLGQDLAGNACVAFSMIADIERAVRAYGGRGYRYVHFEAGAIGQRLYFAAEALGLGSTGIGAFFDDEVHSYLNLASWQGQVVYHFAIGYPIPDTRLEA
jgi:SagB-type dehydrogenase family enzyme